MIRIMREIFFESISFSKHSVLFGCVSGLCRWEKLGVRKVDCPYTHAELGKTKDVTKTNFTWQGEVCCQAARGKAAYGQLACSL